MDLLGIVGENNLILWQVVALSLFGICVALGWWMWKLTQSIREYKAFEQKLSYLSRYDILSGLQNRNAFMCGALKEEWICVTVIVCDIDGLKLVNDNLGHWEGDQLIRRTADILKKVCPAEAQLFRMGGDEFLAILPFVENGEKLQNSLLEQVRLHNDTFNDVPLSLSIGITNSEDKRLPLKEIIRNADYLMYEHKRKGHTYVFDWLQKNCELDILVRRRENKNERW